MKFQICKFKFQIADSIALKYEIRDLKSIKAAKFQMKDQIGLVVLAAGASVRMKRPKQLLSFGGKTLLRRAAETALASDCGKVCVVLGANFEKLREKIRRLKEKKGAEHLHRILQRIDKISARRLFPRDYVRVSRALEVYFQTGKPISLMQPERAAPPPEFAGRIKIFALAPPRDLLYERINARAGRHFQNGLVEEVRHLREARGVSDETNALGAHGYRRVCEYLRGERTLEGAVEQTKLDVRHYAKRQMSWFRREEGVTWLQGFGGDPKTLVKLLSTER